MVAYNFPEFGCAGADSITRVRSANLIDFYDGVMMYQTMKNHSGSASFSITDINSWGIQAKGDGGMIGLGGAVISSVTMTEAEEAIQHEAGVAANPQSPVEGTINILTEYDQQFIMRVKKTISISGFGKSTEFKNDNVGDTFDFTITSAIGTFSIVADDFILNSINWEQTNTDFSKFTAEFSKTTANATPWTNTASTSGLIATTAAEDIALGNVVGEAQYYTIQRTTNMRQDGFVSKDYSIEFFYEETNRAEMTSPTAWS